MAVGTDQALNVPTVLLLGASSQIGIFAIPQLLLAGFRVLAVSRKGKPEGYPAFGQVDWLNETDALQAAGSCQYLLSAGPLELAKKFLTLSRNQFIDDTSSSRPGLRSLRTSMCSRDSSASLHLIQSPFQASVIFSSSSVKTKQRSGDSTERNQMQSMLSLESEIQHAAESRGSKLVIFRPTLIYGCGLDTNISRLANWIRRYGFMPVNGKAVGLRQPVHADDLASVAITAMLSQEALPQVMFLAGGDTLSYLDMVKKIYIALEKPARLVRLPEWFFVLLARFAGASKIGKGINVEMVKRQRVDLVFDDREARELLNYSPRAFAPVKEDFSLPKF